MGTKIFLRPEERFLNPLAIRGKRHVCLLYLDSPLKFERLTIGKACFCQIIIHLSKARLTK